MFDKKTQKKLDRINLDEKNVKEYSLPDTLKTQSAFTWFNKIRPYYLNLFKEQMYGLTAPRPDTVEFEQLDYKNNALGNTATRKIIRMHFRMNSGISRFADILLYIPKKTKKTVPVFVGLNFASNAACTIEKDVPLSHIKPYKSNTGIYDIETATESERGKFSSRWPLEKILGRGYAIATAYYNDFFLDHYRLGFNDSIYSLYYSKEELEKRDNEFGAIGAWAWGLSRILDYLETDKLIDFSKSAVFGHSRLGKTALWAGANDRRFSMVISNASGCGGAALSRRNSGESLEWLLHWRPYWFHRNLQNYIGNEDKLPFDQHTLISLSAPRPVYVASGSEDVYADPFGEFLSLKEAQKCYRLFSSEGLGVSVMPEINTAVQNDLGYHVHKGGHDIGAFDWEQFLDFADLHFGA